MVMSREMCRFLLKDRSHNLELQSESNLILRSERRFDLSRNAIRRTKIAVGRISKAGIAQQGAAKYRGYRRHHTREAVGREKRRRDRVMVLPQGKRDHRDQEGTVPRKDGPSKWREVDRRLREYARHRAR